MNIAFLSIGVLKNQHESARLTLLLLAKEMIKRGHKVTIYARHKGNVEPHEVVEGVPIVRHHGRLPLYLRRVQRQSQPFDVIHSFSAMPLFAFSAALAKVGEKTKLVHTLKSYSKHPAGNVYWPLRVADVITVPTKVFARKVGREDTTRIVRSPIDLQKFCPRDKEELKMKYGCDGRKVILYYGALWKEKGVEILLNALPQLIVQDKSWKLIIAARHAVPQKLNEMIASLHLGGYVEWKENIPIEEYVAMADAVVLPYLSLRGTEGNPSCMLEAMACKTSVITSDLPELREIADGCVHFTPPGDVDELGRMLKSVLRKQDKAMVEKAYEKAHDFDVKKIAEEFLKVYGA